MIFIVTNSITRRHVYGIATENRLIFHSKSVAFVNISTNLIDYMIYFNNVSIITLNFGTKN